VVGCYSSGPVDAPIRNTASACFDQLKKLVLLGDQRITLLNGRFEDLAQALPDLVAQTERERHLDRMQLFQGLNQSKHRSNYLAGERAASATVVQSAIFAPNENPPSDTSEISQRRGNLASESRDPGFEGRDHLFLRCRDTNAGAFNL
jgi:hypothetical protein